MYSSIREVRSTLHTLGIERTKNVDKASAALPHIEASRHQRAEIASLEERVAELRKETQKIRDAYSTGAKYPVNIPH